MPPERRSFRKRVRQAFEDYAPYQTPRGLREVMDRFDKIEKRLLDDLETEPDPAVRSKILRELRAGRKDFVATLEIAGRGSDMGRKLALAIRIRAEIEDTGIDPMAPDFARKETGAAALAALRLAMETGDAGQIADAAKKYADLTGVSAPQKHQHDLGFSLESVEELAQAMQDNECSPPATPDKKPTGNGS